MQDSNNQVIIVIITTILILLFFGVVFLIMISYYNNRKLLAIKEKQMLKDSFEKQLLQSRLEIQDQILNSISQEIHDNVGQNLSLAKVQVNIIEESGIFNKNDLIDIKDSISRAIADLRDITRSLSSQRVQQLRIHELINAELQRITKTGIADTVFDIAGIEKDLGFREKLILFRMIQEGLQNIVKHAQARNIKVSINYTDSHLEIVISDDGKGFDIKQELEAGSGLGLQNIMNRAALIKGKALITSVINKGTCIDINIPYE
jgi:two-component system, NarL family, sensor kinase